MNINKHHISFIVLSDDWGEHPSSCQHIFRHISTRYPVLWVNTIGMRNPQLTFNDFMKAIRKISKMFSRLGVKKDGQYKNSKVHDCQPPMLPFLSVPGVRKINRYLVAKIVRRRLSKLGLEHPVFVTTVPNACDFVGLFGERRVLYYCVDDFAEWPGLEKNLVKEMEEELIRKSDIFVATSHKLYEKLSRYEKPIYLLTHGVDLDLFGRQHIGEHPLLSGIPKPRLGYFGLFDERSDQELLADVARRMPDISFVITGRVVVGTSCLKNLSNIYFTGKIPYSELPAMVSGWDACFLPYLKNKLTETISPLKLKEYLASGKPVVSTAVPEVQGLEDYVAIAEGVEEWVKCFYISLRGVSKEERVRRSAFLKNESWSKKAEQFLEVCLNLDGTMN